MREYLAALVILLSALGPATCGGNTDGSKSEVPANTESVVLSVPDMSCPACPLRVKAGLSRAEGVISVRATLETKTAEVVYDPAKTDVNRLIEAVRDTGFEAAPAGP